ncbi:hypothetical protein J0L31_11385 [Terrisporobacter glycolicus]|nr:hypothetical protein [Terrisporobacter glycolicus]
MEGIWNKIIDALSKSEKEFPTIPKTKKEPVWFLANTDGDKIYINEAVENSPSSTLKCKRTLTYEKFKEIYPIYLRREKGEKVSNEATNITRNQVYYYSLIKHLGN